MFFERKISFPVNNEKEAAVLAMDIILQAAEVEIVALPEIPEEEGDACKSLTMVLFLNERQAAFFDQTQELIAQLGPIMDLLKQEPISFTTH